jgi:alpha-tubulin suppressor-like RCC1 family protein
VGSSTNKTFTVTYSGAVPATGVTDSGLSTPFSFNGGTCGSTISSGTCTVIANFSPTAGGTVNQTLTLNYNNGASATTATRPVKGTGAAPAVLTISGSPTYDYGTQANGSSHDATLTVTNSGTITATTVAASGLSTPFSFTGGGYPGTGGTCGTSIPAGTCTIVVNFTPASTGNYSNTLQMTYFDGTTSQQTNLGVTGHGATPGLLSISDGPTYDYGTSARGSFNDHTYTVTNSGGAPALTDTASGPSLPFKYKGGSYPGTGGTCGSPIAGSSNCTIVVQFDPTVNGLKTDTIEIDYFDGLNNQIATRPVKGTGTDPALLAISDGPTYSYGQQGLGSSTNHTFNVTYSGGVPATTDVETGLTAPYSITGGTCGSPISANCTIIVNYAPLSAGTYNQTLSLQYYDGATSQTATRPITATAAAPTQLVVAGQTPLPIGNCGAYTVTSEDNIGNPSTVGAPTTVTLGGAGAGAFYSDSNCQTPTTTVSIGTGTSVQNFYFKGTIVETDTLTASNGGLTTGQLAVQIISVVQMVSAGGYHACAVVNYGVQCTGWNKYGQLGNGANLDSSLPVQVTNLGLGTGATSVSAGYEHTCALVNGGVQCWGINANGELGQNNTTNTNTPVTVVGLSSGVTALAAGAYHNCVIVSGGVKCWGYNNWGALGDNTTTDRWTPVNVVGLGAGSGVVSITAGYYHTCVMLNDGSVRCWGHNGSGQLGNNSTTYSPTPVTPSTFTSGTTVLAAGGYTTCGVLNGDTKCWGSNSNGQIGDGTTVDRHVPTQVSSLAQIFSNISTSLAVGDAHACAIVNGVAAECWGYNNSGQIGNGTNVQQQAPAGVTGLATGMQQISAGTQFSCGVQNNAGVCWGNSAYGQLGYSSTVNWWTFQGAIYSASATILTAYGAPAGRVIQNQCTPFYAVSKDVNGNVGYVNAAKTVNLSGTGTTTFYSDATCTASITSVTIPAYKSNALFYLVDTAVESFSLGLSGPGFASGSKSLNVVAASSITDGSISAGQYHACAVVNGGVQCWGWNQHGQLGYGTTGWQGEAGAIAYSTFPVQVVGLPPGSGATQVVTGWNHTCAIVNGGVQCWGYNQYGQVGDNTIVDKFAPVAVSGLTSGVTQIAAGQYHTCVLQNNAVKCFGYNGYGQIGDDTTADRHLPVNVLQLNGGVTSIAAGDNSTCAVVAGGLKCWGNNSAGRIDYIGLGDTNQPMVTDFLSLGSGVDLLSMKYAHGCVTISGDMKCFGSNGNGQLGDGTTTQRWTPVQVAGLTTGVTGISMGDNFSCANVGGALKCWGYNANGQLGIGTNTQMISPQQVTGLTSGVTWVGSGVNSNVCALASGVFKCWGYGYYGQVGNSATFDPWTPFNVFIYFSPSQFVFAGTPRLTAGDCKPYTAILKDTNGNISYAASAITVTPGGAGSGAFYSDPQCTTPAATATILADRAMTTVYYTNATPSTPTLTANGGGLTQGSQAVTVTAPGSVYWGAVASGGYHSCAVVNGGVQCWGWNGDGQVGNAAAGLYTSLPMQVTGLPPGSGVTAVAAGYRHTCAIVSGGLKCWGLNGNGQLGNNTNVTSQTPVQVQGLTSGVQRVFGGAQHTCALVNSGVKCWGYNGYYQVGDNTGTDRWVPTNVIGLSVGVTALASNEHHNCAVYAGGLRCWGNNSSYRLGIIGYQPNTIAPPDWYFAGNGVEDVVAGDSFTCAIVSGAAKCMGYNANGQIGDGTTTTRLTLTQVTGLTSGVVAITSGNGYSCALLNTGDVQCWGYNSTGQLGIGNNTQQLNPQQTTGLTSGVQWISAGDAGNTTCALVSGVLKCWGYDYYGAIGNGATGDQWTPQNVIPYAAASQMALSGPGSVVAGTCSTAYTVGILDPSGNLSYASSGLTVTLGGGGSGTFYSDGGCTSALSGNQLTISSDTGMTPFYFKDTSTESLTFTADASTYTQATLAVASIAQTSVVASQFGVGQFHACAIVNGGVQCWGADYNGGNMCGQLGDNLPFLYSSRPVQVQGLPPGSGATAIAVGYNHSCAIINGGLKCWGNNGNGQLGNNTNANSWVPVQVQGLTSGVTQVVAGNQHTCALVNGVAKCWGYNGYDQLGDNTSTDRWVPVNVQGLLGGVTQLAASGYQTCALVAGGLRCWGSDSSDRIGIMGDVLNEPTPIDNFYAFKGVTAVAMGDSTTCAIVNGAAQCMGYNTYGEVGDGTNVQRNTLTQVSGLTSGVTAVAVGNAHSCAVASGGAIKCWGYNLNGELGNGNNTNQWTPVQTSGLTSGGQAVALGDNNDSCAMVSGALKCWGYGYYGELGNYASADSWVPVNVVNYASPNTLTLEGNAKLIVSDCKPYSVIMKDNATNGNLSYAASATVVSLGGQGSGTFYSDQTCTTSLAGGGNTVTVPADKTSVTFYYSNAALSEGDTLTASAGGFSSASLGVSIVAAPAVAISGGQNHGCAAVNGKASCWGYNNYGQVGDNTLVEKHLPTQVVGLTSGVTQVVSGYSHSCAIVSGGVKCWGYNAQGMLGDNTNVNRSTPVQVTGLTSGVQQIVAGANHTCALVNSGVKCWGYNGYNQIGDNTGTDRWTPVTPVGLSSGVTAISASGTQTCAIVAGGMRCWGNNGSNRLGINGFVANEPTPVDNYHAGKVVQSIVQGDQSTCAIINGILNCWGYNVYGQLGDNTTISRAAPMPVSGLGTVDSFCVGNVHACAVSGGDEYCWGYNNYGQVGDVTNINRYTPTQVFGLTTNVAAPACGQNNFTNAIMTDNTGRGWGYNGNGQLGSNNTTNYNSPFTMSAFP